MWSCFVTTHNLSLFVIFKENLQGEFCTMGLSSCSLYFPCTVQGLGTALQQVSFREGWLHLTQFMVNLKVLKIKSNFSHHGNPSLSVFCYQLAHFWQIVKMWSCGRVFGARLYRLWVMVTFHWYRKTIHNEQNGFDFFPFALSRAFHMMAWTCLLHLLHLKMRHLLCMRMKTTSLFSTARYT